MTACNYKNERKAPKDQQHFFNQLELFDKEINDVVKSRNTIQMNKVYNDQLKRLKAYNNKIIHKWIGCVDRVKYTKAFGGMLYVNFDKYQISLSTDMLASKNDISNNELIKCFAKLKQGDWVMFDGKIDIESSSFWRFEEDYIIEHPFFEEIPKFSEQTIDIIPIRVKLIK